MPDYKKKKHSRINLPAKPKRVKQRVEEDYNIEMTSRTSHKKQGNKQSMKVVKGNKAERFKKFKVTVAIIAIIAVTVTVLQIAMPMGAVESISNAVSLIGTGGYPIDLESTQTVNAISRGQYYYILSNTQIYAYTNAGKRLFSYAHGFENPVIKTSASRAMVFEQGGNQALIFTHSGLKEAVSSEKEIITAAISDSGAYALATSSDKYTSAVTVFNKRNIKVYEWFSAEKVVNNVVISPNGKKMAVSAFDSNNGKYVSELNVLNFKSANPEYKESFEDALVYNLDSTYKSGFTVITPKAVKFIKWHKYKTTEYKNDYTPTIFRTGKTEFITVFNRESDKTDNHIAVFSKTGKLKYELQYKGIISDIAVLGGHIYCMSDSEVGQLNREGVVLRKSPCGFGSVRVVATATSTCAVITDNKIEKIKLEQEKK